MIIKFTSLQLIKNYCHIGYGARSSKDINSFFYVGSFYSIYILSIKKILNILRNYFFLINTILLKGGKLLIIWNSFFLKFGKLKFKNYTFAKLINSSSQHSLLSNYKAALANKKIFFPNSLISHIFSQTIHKQFNLEKKILLPSLSLIDTYHNNYSFNNFIITNTKSIISSNFYLNILFSYFNIIDLKKKKKFIYDKKK